MDRIGSGFRLRVPHNEDAAPTLVDGIAIQCKQQPRESIVVSTAQAEQLIGSGLLTKLTEHGEGQRLGWRSAGYDGDVADWWVCTQ